jgi:branched-chain amino acid transport system permease protein
MAIEIVTLLSTILTFFGIYLILALSLNLEYGFGGQPNFGKVFFYSTGAYVSAMFTVDIITWLASITEPLCYAISATPRNNFAAANPPIIIGIFVASLLLALAIGAAFGYIFSYPTLKLREDYLAITLLMVGEISRLFVRSTDFIVCGTHGLGGIPNPFIWLGNANAIMGSYAVVVLALAFACYVFAQRLVNSPYGRVLKAIRDDETVAMGLGKVVPWRRGEILAIGSALAAMAGVLYAFFINFVQPDDFVTLRTVDAWVIVILGGLASNRGTVLGAFIFTLLDRLSRLILVEILNVQLPFEINYVRNIVVALLLVVILVFQPKGIVPEGPLKTPALASARERTRLGSASVLRSTQAYSRIKQALSKHLDLDKR